MNDFFSYTSTHPKSDPKKTTYEKKKKKKKKTQKHLKIGRGVQ